MDLGAEGFGVGRAGSPVPRGRGIVWVGKDQTQPFMDHSSLFSVPSWNPGIVESSMESIPPMLIFSKGSDDPSARALRKAAPEGD